MSITGVLLFMFNCGIMASVNLVNTSIQYVNICILVEYNSENSVEHTERPKLTSTRNTGTVIHMFSS